MMESRMRPDRVDPARPARVAVKPVKQVAFAAALGLAALAAVAPNTARAQSGEATLFGSIVKSLGIGGDNDIEYRERPPLVVPPSRDLPPPQTAGAARNPNWPVDPKATDGQKGAQVRNLDRMAPADSTMPSSQPASGGFFSNIFGSSKPAGPIGVPPERKNLTDPPRDYQSRSPDQPYGEPSPAPPAKSTTPASALQTPPGAPAPGGSGGL
jgi:hypothetical protein